MSIVEDLLKHGAKVDEKDGAGFTALHLAAIRRHDTVVQLSLKHGANIDVKSKIGKTALQLAVQHKRFDTAKILRKSGG